jgi:hypothetical protein
MDSYLVVPEEAVKQAVEFFERLKEPSNFLNVYNAGQEFKSAGLTPIYLLDQAHMDLFVVAKETYKKKLH